MSPSTRPRRVVMGGLVVVLCLLLLVIGNAGFKHLRKHPEANRGSTSTAPAPSSTRPPAITSSTPVPITTPHAPTTAPVGPVNSANSQSAVNFAATAINLLATAVLKPTNQADQLVSYLVVPGQQAALQAQLKNAGPLYVKQWGYASLADADANAAYSVDVQKYRVTQYSSNIAVISLYTVSHWVTADNYEYRVPAISIVHLQKEHNAWLYVSMERPPASQQPTPKLNLTYDQTAQAFGPFLKGYVSYVASNE